MTIFKRLFDFYINASIHVAVAVCALSIITLINFNLAIDWDLIFVIFFATISSYNFVRYFGLAKFHHRRLASWLKHIQIFSFFCFLALCYFIFQIDQQTIMYLVILGGITFFYAIPFLPRKIFVDGKKNLRAISGLKIYVIAFVWAAVTVIIPLLNENYSLNNDMVVTSFQRFIYVIVATLPFEIRDMQYDSLKLGTIPQRIGVNRTKIIGVLLILIFYFIEFFKDDIDYQKLFVLPIIALLMLCFLAFSRTNQSQYYSSFWIEGIPIIWLGLLFL
ncbi:MAG: hypothetical protein KJO77_02340 [Bacteroidia bacterium]|nr:hypothetical protein [Bacteroidia bacterium]NND52077.1 hypothetical protein [Flavobacteriaceae bacterium]